MLHKKVMNVIIPKEFTKTQKMEAFNYFVKWYHIEALKYHINVDEKTNFTVLYEIYCSLKFGKDQPSVHSITFLAENSTRSVDQQKASLLQTKQKNCDLSVTYESNDSSNTKVISLLDILIGRNKEIKGNLVFTKTRDITAINDQKKHMLFELNKYKDNNTLSKLDKDLIQQKIMLIENLEKSNMTPAAQTIVLQEYVISLIPLIRKIIPNYNPNMIVFMPENESPSLSTLGLEEKLKSHIPYDFSINTPNAVTEQIIRKTLPMYLEYKKPDLSVMSPTERNFCLEVIKKYAPDYYATLYT